MKKIELLTAAVLSILAAVSCAKETSDNQKESANPGGARTTLSASLLSTRTALGEKEGTAWPNYWKEGDQISVNGVTSDALGEEADGNASATFSFEGNLETPYYAAYPASAVSGYENGSATLTVPATQAYVEGSYDPAAFVMGGKSTTAGSVVLSPCVSIFHLSLSGSASISSVRLTGAEGSALSGTFTTDFTSFTPATVSNAVEMVADEPVALPADFFICIPAGLTGSFQVKVYDTEGGSMTRSANISEAIVAGQMYSPATLPYAGSYNIAITAEGITSSTAVICWDNAPEAAYTIGVYADEGCNTLVNSYAVPAGDACWGGESPRFCISGLEAATTYYVKVTNVTKSVDSNILPVTTEEFEIVEVSPEPAEKGDVILAEDFSELQWDCDMIGGGAGWFPTEAAQTSFATVEVGSYQAAATSSEKQLSSQTNALAGSRLQHWAQGANRNMYIHPGYIKLVGNSKVTHLVTPALNNIPEGMVATLEVEVTASRYYSASNDSYATDKAIVSVEPAGVYGELVSNSLNTLDLESNVANITLPAQTAWKTFKVTLNGVSKGDRLAFGAAKSVTKNEARMNISDMKVTIKELYDAGTLTASVKGVSSSTAVFTWTHMGSASQDVAKPYTIALYSDSACSNLVVSHNIPANDECWSSKIPCFVFGGLNPNTEYWFVATDTEASVSSEPVSATTDAFTVVDATSVTDAAVGDVILAEDFSEIAHGPDEFAYAAGFVPETHQLTYIPSGVNPDGGYVVYNNTGNRLYGSGWDVSGSRLEEGWGFFGNSAVYSRNGYLRITTTSSGARTHLVTPALSGIPDGKLATIEVTVTATKNEVNDNDVAVFVEKGLTMNGTEDRSSGSFHKYTGASLSKGHAFGITTSREWETRSVTVSNVDAQSQLVIGSLENIDTKNRFSISDVVVTLVALKNPGDIDEVMEINDFTTLKAFLTACNTGNLTIQGNVTADIDLTSSQLEEIDALYPIPEFDGIINGNNHTISGLAKPLIDELRGTVSDLTLNSVLNITEDVNNVGILACYASSATISGCTTMGSVSFANDSQVSGSIALGGMVGILSGCALTNCQNQATVENTTNASVGILIGGLSGESESSTFVTCSNTAAISNSGLAADFSGYPCDLNMGGLVGYLHGVNTLTGTSGAYNYNSGDITESSTCTYVGVGGIAGSSAGEGTDMAYAHNTGDITFRNNTRYNSYIGGIVGCAEEIFTMDYANNSGDLIIRSITISHQSWIGGILGGFNVGNTTTKSAALTVTGCVNSGDIDCPNASSGANMAAASSSVTSFSYMGGISGVGDCGSKQFINCSNSGHIAVYNQIKMRLGGVVGYVTNNPTGCVNTGPINYCRYKGPGNSGASVVGGIMGYTGIATPHDLTNDATVRTTGSSPASLCGGIAGQVGGDTTGFENCNVGSSTGSQKTISGAGEGNWAKANAAGLFTSVSSSRAWDFTGCKIKNGTKCQNMTVTSDNLNSALIGNNKPPTSVTNPPVFVDSF